MSTASTTGLVLSGGGARAAYQVGVLRAIAQLHRASGAPRRNPFGIICGTSAGAINAAALACNADQFESAVEGMVRVWSQFHAEQVYRADSLGVIRSGAQWLTLFSIGWLIARWRKARPRSLLDNAPLADLMRTMVPLERLPRMIAGRHVQALAVTASSYTSGEHVTFYQSHRPLQPWVRSQRVAISSRLTHAHLMASSAIPFVFPSHELPMESGPQWFGDGSMRQTSPLSPAIHLGAEKVLVIGAGRMHEPPGRKARNLGYPSLAQIAGHALSGIFLDALANDIERLERINRTLAMLPPQALQDTALRRIETLVIAPSRRIDEIAASHQAALPPAVRGLLRGFGAGASTAHTGGAALASYLLFEAPYTQELMALGEADTMAREQEVLQFFGWHAKEKAPQQRGLEAAAGPTATQPNC